MNSYTIFPAILFLLIATPTHSIAKNDFVDVYPRPAGIKGSGNFKVAVEQNEIVQESFVYYSTPLDNDADNAANIRHEVVRGINENEALRDFYFGGDTKGLEADQSCSFTSFSFSGKISVLVQNLHGKIEKFKILPSSKKISGTTRDNILSFEIDRPEKLAIVLNDDHLNPLFLFADAPERAVPDKNAPGTLVISEGMDMALVKEKAKEESVLWFEPGVHNIGVAFPVYANQTIYMAGGAYLLGTISGFMASNVTIRGRGVLAGDNISRQKVLDLKIERQKNNWERQHYHAINMLSEDNKTSWNSYADFPGSGCDNLTIEGITIASPRQFFIRATGVPITIYNVKMVGAWPYNTDGVSTIGQANTTVYDCFFHCNDDAIYVSPNDAHIHHNIFWQGNNGCVFQFSWGGAPKDQGGAYIHDCDIIHDGHVSEANNRMLIGSRKSGEGSIRNVHFKNINIEGPVWSLFRLETNGSGELGSIENIIMENIFVNGPVFHKSRILSSKGKKEDESSTSWIRNILFRNVVINGEPLRMEDIEIGDFQVEKITIE